MARNRDWVPRDRALVLLDIENLAGDPFVSADVARAVVDRTLRSAGVRAGDHVIIGCNPRLGIAAGAACPGARLVVGRGPDGADQALLATSDADDVARRYDRVVIRSGDHAFAPLARALRRRGVPVTVISRRGAISHHLVPGADRVVVTDALASVA